MSLVLNAINAVSAVESGGCFTEADRTRHWLLQELQKGRFSPGEAVKESLLAREYGVNRNAMREALNHLAGTGLLDYVPYCGYRMREYCLRDLLQWYELREAVEPIAARRVARTRPPAVMAELAAALAIMEMYLVDVNDASRLANDQADVQFHLALVRGCGNRNLAQMEVAGRILATFFDYSDSLRYREESMLRHFDHMPTREEFDEFDRRITFECHRDIYRAIMRGDALAAERITREHAANQVRNLESLPPEILSMALKEAGRKLGRAGGADAMTGIASENGATAGISRRKK